MASSPPEPTMWLSTRKRFDSRDPGWDEFMAFIGLSHLIEARSIDSSLNECVDGNRSLFDVAELWSTLNELAPAKTEMEYHLLFIDAAKHPDIQHEALTLLGYDLSDETWTSSVLNCGKWDGPLKCLADTIQSNGLLTLDAAKAAQTMLPRVGPGSTQLCHDLGSI